MIVLIGNWKMAPEKASDALTLAKKTQAIAREYKKTLNTIICVPSIHIAPLTKTIKTTLGIGGQSVAARPDIAQTGYMSAGMLKSYGASYCIVGHSEVRARGENDADTLAEVLTLVAKKVSPIICVGEKERDAHGWYLSTVKGQVETIINGIPRAQLKNLIFAYEPVWAIGADAVREATVAECREMIIFIRKVIADATDEKIAKSIRIIYGGSVNEENVAAFVLESGAQGFLVGRLSLDAKRFGTLAKILSQIA